jgi:hypothetical protein
MIMCREQVNGRGNSFDFSIITSSHVQYVPRRGNCIGHTYFLFLTASEIQLFHCTVHCTLYRRATRHVLTRITDCNDVDGAIFENIVAYLSSWPFPSRLSYTSVTCFGVCIPLWRQCNVYGFFWHKLVTCPGFRDKYLMWTPGFNGSGFILQLMQPRCYTSRVTHKSLLQWDTN